MACPYIGEQICGLPGPLLDFSGGDVAITSEIEEEDSIKLNKRIASITVSFPPPKFDRK